MTTTAKNFNISEAEQILLRETLLVCTRRQVFPNIGIFYGENPFKYSFPLMMMEIIVVVVITQIMRFLLRPLKQPRVVSEILGGIIVGRSVLGSSARFRKYVFPTDAIFVLKNLGLVGFMYFLFVAGVKTDVRLMKQAGRKQWIIGVISVFAPMICTIIVVFSLLRSMNDELAKPPSVLGVTALFSVTAFPVLSPIVKEFNLMSSEIGRMSLSITLITVVMGINFAVIFEAAQQGSIKGISALWSLLSFIFYTLAIFIAFRPAMFWIVRTTPQGKPIAEVYVIGILLSVMVSGFLADTFGMALCNGPMWLGLAIPDGPPLGAILVEKTETFLNTILMPLGFMFVGMITDVSSLATNWLIIEPFFILAMTAVTVKLIATFIASQIVKMPAKEGLALSLLMNLRGQMELVMLIRFMDLRIITSPTFALLVLVILAADAIATPLVGLLYNPTRPYMVNKRRTIQHTPLNSELRVVACFFDDSSVVSVINLLELSNSAMSAPIYIYALHIVELVAQSNPLVIEHNEEAIEMESEENGYSSLHRALQRFKESRRQDIEIHHYTIMTAKRTMYQDICELALLKKASLIVLPFEQKHAVINNTTETMSRGVRQVDNDVLEHAPCSVAIFVSTTSIEKNLVNISKNTCRRNVMVLFLGGADSREALTYADRISVNPNVFLIVIRFLSRDEKGDDKMEKKLDDGLITWFWVKHEANNRVIYREVVVENGEETIAAIQDLTNDDCDLFIVGRKQGINPVILQGLLDWSENNELGVVGDYICSSNVGKSASLLVLQQQILRG